MKIRAVIRELLDESSATDEIVERVMSKCTKADFTPLIVDEIKMQRRNMVRGRERDARIALIEPMRDQNAGLSAATVSHIEPSYDYVRERLERLRAVAAETFALGDGHEVTWGDATIVDHRKRIAMLTKQVRGITDTIAQHEVAIQVIMQSGGTCLNEVQEAS